MKATHRISAFSLVENLIAIALVALLGLSLNGTMILAGKLARAARQDITATEILEARLEALRTCSWKQIKIPAFVPTNFYASNDVVYQGTITLLPVTGSETYNSNLVEVLLQVDWKTDNRQRSLSLSSYISPYGFSAP